VISKQRGQPKLTKEPIFWREGRIKKYDHFDYLNDIFSLGKEDQKKKGLKKEKPLIACVAADPD